MSSGPVIGSLILGVGHRASLAQLIPASTLFKTGREHWSRGSGSQRESCRFCTAVR